MRVCEYVCDSKLIHSISGLFSKNVAVFQRELPFFSAHSVMLVLIAVSRLFIRFLNLSQSEMNGKAEKARTLYIYAFKR